MESVPWEAAIEEPEEVAMPKAASEEANARYRFLVNNVAKYSLVLLGINWKYNPHFLFRKYTWKLHLIVFLKSNILQDNSLKSDLKWVVILRSVSGILKWKLSHIETRPMILSKFLYMQDKI